MKQILKAGIAALALAAIAPTFAQDVEETEGTVGWTPIALGLATPVQLPWGLNRWDVYGLDLNLFYSDAPDFAGLDFGGFATTVRRETKGIVFSALFNLGCEDVYGLRVTCGLNMCARTVKGVELGLISFRNSFYGFDAHLLGNAQRNQCGFQIGGLANVSAVESYGVSLAGISNLARTSYGLQLSAIFNMTDELHGAQIALVNYAKECPSGFQIGLVNIIMDNRIKVLPFVNGYF